MLFKDAIDEFTNWRTFNKSVNSPPVRAGMRAVSCIVLEYRDENVETSTYGIPNPVSYNMGHSV